MKFEDKIIAGSFNDLKANLIKIQQQLNEGSSKISISKPDDFLGVTLKNVLNYSSILVNRLLSSLELPIELNAWLTRNLFECYLIAEYITINPEKAKEFVVQKATDEIEIYEGILTLKKYGATEETAKPILDRMEHIRNIVKEHELTESKHWSVGLLATHTGNREEYEAFFKLYSKYVHPSSWLINGKENEYENPTFKAVFLLQGQYYASCILKISSKYEQQHS
ncbi:DUF5677 domain-containing protein [Pseudobacter ginsenosidimutans]|uniref:Uncharacterized protein n=1 Tax=Pseudobacter ginsenosidimutans TaxID=661488 RepID=A0A4Q7N4T7_9BACT|nr:DUF5677 domain-containing protein [Pseudobacter ginsenosidimutans]QEC44564.1 hypothetical protein FSB84_23870 [Pseudobacter ginsenosidimutans]RZS76042.1 hypothetical protein EV199_1919 [Pseudobacter ginsenosidimutans]